MTEFKRKRVDDGTYEYRGFTIVKKYHFGWYVFEGELDVVVPDKDKADHITESLSDATKWVDRLMAKRNAPTTTGRAMVIHTPQWERDLWEKPDYFAKETLFELERAARKAAEEAQTAVRRAADAAAELARAKDHVIDAFRARLNEPTEHEHSDHLVHTHPVFDKDHSFSPNFDHEHPTSEPQAAAFRAHCQTEHNLGFGTFPDMVHGHARKHEDDRRERAS